MLALRMRNNVTLDIHSRYYKDIVYYKLNNTAKNKIANPDQRITQGLIIIILITKNYKMLKCGATK
jgi:ABC-type uncharacterized transport system fused permease/ATPase subunit